MRSSVLRTRSRALCEVGGIAAAAIAAIVGCAGSGASGVSTQETGTASLDLSQVELVDLSHTYDESTIYWPNSPSGFVHRRLAYGKTDGGYFYSSYSFSSPEHGGTHIDAPIHFAAKGWTVDEVPLERLVVPMIVIDVREAAAANRDYRLAAQDVTQWERRHGRVPAGSAVILRTGWSRFWPDARQYLGDDTPGDTAHLHFPSFGADAARLLVEQRKVALIGVDTASIDYGPSPDFPVHQVACGANVAGLENLTHLDALPATGAWLVALPMKIGEGSGGPVRAVALVP